MLPKNNRYKLKFEMKNTIFVILMLVTGCIGGEVDEAGIVDIDGDILESGPRSVALTAEDLGSVGWVRSAENDTEFVFERRFRRVEDTFGAVSALVNRVHLYPDAESALLDFHQVEEQLREEVGLSNPDVGDEALLWIQGDQGYLLFVRNSFLVEFEYSTTRVVEGDFLVEQARKVDSKIIS